MSSSICLISHPLRFHAETNGSPTNLLFRSPNPKGNPLKHKWRNRFRCYRINKDKPEQEELFQGFSALPSDVPWDIESVWSTIAAHIFILHIPLSFGGLSIVSRLLHQPVLDPWTETVSILVLQTTELLGTLLLLRYTVKKKFVLLPVVFRGKKSPEGRKWVKASALALGFLILLVLVSSFVLDRLTGVKAANNTILKELLLSGTSPKVAFFWIYCFVTPMLEETVYRGFLLSSLASTMKWQNAVIISSCVFSASHFSGENFVQLFLIGCVLGSTYCWTGDIRSSFAVHSLYNAILLLFTILS
ncbi:hypothetical protein QJS10_CPA06g00392 [Acorus calamus]|uniref:CAAX prenyl protease 2/Lysostaphin resistance protein A-like domain-containing protein n=1 Tax=Acorus calamus TaxID=4465 RepID=A0AAV9EI28_ACOCL|nr:hypothetical protein QJS10_CPA06g00392 [Acorus calamus]